MKSWKIIICGECRDARAPTLNYYVFKTPILSIKPIQHFSLTRFGDCKASECREILPSNGNCRVKKGWDFLRGPEQCKKHAICHSFDQLQKVTKMASLCNHSINLAFGGNKWLKHNLSHGAFGRNSNRCVFAVPGAEGKSCKAFCAKPWFYKLYPRVGGCNTCNVSDSNAFFSPATPHKLKSSLRLFTLCYTHKLYHVIRK